MVSLLKDIHSPISLTNRDESCLRYCIVAPHSTRISRAKTISTVQVSNLLKSGWFVHSSDLNLTLMYYSIDEPYFRLCIVFLESSKHIHIWTWHYKCMSVTITTIKSSSRICHAILVLCFSCHCSFLCYYSVGDFFVRNIPPWKRLLTLPHTQFVADLLRLITPGACFRIHF